MKIEYIQISNILSFKYCADLDAAPKILFDEGLNILIGQNGSGKSTVLEIINFFFKRVFFAQYSVNHDAYGQRSLTDHVRMQILRRINNNNIAGFRLDPNWESESLPQKFRIKVILDDVDKVNLGILKDNKHKLTEAERKYSQDRALNFDYQRSDFLIEISLNKGSNNFSILGDHTSDAGFSYFVLYHYFRELIELHNKEYPNDPIPGLRESFTLIGGYRNYNAFSSSVSLSQEASRQVQSLREQEYGKSANSTEGNEPAVFSLVRLKVAERHQEVVFTERNAAQAAEIANSETFLNKINQKLSLVNLKVRIELENRNIWAYSFRFFDTRTGREVNDINSLSAGQKSIVHLVFEAYGRGDIKGGVVIIDEPEIHLHYQFQHEYLRIIEQINEEQKNQYILVTHSEALISSKTIQHVKRFSLDGNKNTAIKAPKIIDEQKNLVKILDNTRSAYAFFAQKVVLVEGDSDRYFFNSVFRELKPELRHEIAILDVGGKGSFAAWKSFFESFGLTVYIIGDFDNVFQTKIPGCEIISRGELSAIRSVAQQNLLNTLSDDQKEELKNCFEAVIEQENYLQIPQSSSWNPLVECYKRISKVAPQAVVSAVRLQRQDLDAKIDAKYSENVFILKKGSLEAYTRLPNKNLSELIPFCQEIGGWLSRSDEYTEEIKQIVAAISASGNIPNSDIAKLLQAV